jgi:shikimate dehydrogenase
MWSQSEGELRFSVVKLSSSILSGNLVASIIRRRKSGPSCVAFPAFSRCVQGIALILGEWGQMISQISGKTRLWGILADPVAHVKTPQMINQVALERGVDGVMVPFHVAPDDLAALVKGLKGMKSLHGFVVTVPHKTAIVDLLDEVSESARLIGAVNTVRREEDGRLIGEMLDGIGFVTGLKQAGIDPKGLSAYLAGAGGAANAIAFALIEAGVTHLTIANRTQSKVEDLIRRLKIAYPLADVRIGTADPAGHDLVVNGTSLGLKTGDALPFMTETLQPCQIIAEVIMDPEETAVMAHARAKGCRVHPGKPMLASMRYLIADFMGVI